MCAKTKPSTLLLSMASIMRDAATAKPQLFLFDDAWFATNLISRLNQIDE